jgi:hypothetical protein
MKNIKLMLTNECFIESRENVDFICCPIYETQNRWLEKEMFDVVAESLMGIYENGYRQHCAKYLFSMAREFNIDIFYYKEYVNNRMTLNLELKRAYKVGVD